MTMTITVDHALGTSIQMASVDAQRLADLLGVNVAFKFNDTKCTARPRGSPDKLVEGYHAVREGEQAWAYS